MPVELLSPRGVSHSPQNPIAPRLEGLDNKILGLLDTSKDNADLFLSTVAEFIGKSFNIPEIIKIKKPIGSVPASFTQEFLEKCDYVINAFAD